MPMELAEKINLVEDVDVFVHNFVDESLPLSNTSTLVQHPTSRKRKNLKKSYLLNFIHCNSKNAPGKRNDRRKTTVLIYYNRIWLIGLLTPFEYFTSDGEEEVPDTVVLVFS